MLEQISSLKRSSYLKVFNQQLISKRIIPSFRDGIARRRRACFFFYFSPHSHCARPIGLVIVVMIRARNQWWIYALLLLVLFSFVEWKKVSATWWAELPSYDIKIDRMKQRKHREVYIIQTKSFAFIHSFAYTQRVKNNMEIKLKVTIIWCEVWLLKRELTVCACFARSIFTYFFFSYHSKCYFLRRSRCRDCCFGKISRLDNSIICNLMFVFTMELKPCHV